MNSERDDLDRIATSGAWIGMLLYSIFITWLSTKIPYLAAWIPNTIVIGALCYGMARWKRNPVAWGAFWVILGLCVANIALRLATGMVDGQFTPASCVIGVLMTYAWYRLVQSGRTKVAAPVRVEHHVYHYGLPQQAAQPQAVYSVATLEPEPATLARGRSDRSVAKPARLAIGPAVRVLGVALKAGQRKTR